MRAAPQVGHARFLDFAKSSRADWRGNFRDLNAAITRMATLSPSGRITTDAVDAEIGRLLASWRGGRRGAEPGADALEELLGPRVDAIDLFDRVQLAAVIAVCRRTKSLSEAGRELFAASRKLRSSSNDADRLRKYLARFDLAWQQVCRSPT